MDHLSLLVIFIAGIIGSSFGTLVGGTSLMTIPLLIFLGLPPHTAIGTDRLGIAGLALTGWYKFHEKGWINYKIALMMGITALVGSFLGANLALKIEVSVLRKIIAFTTFIMLMIVVLKPGIGIEEKKTNLTRRGYGIGLSMNLLIGVYGGFYGAMAGTFMLYVLLFFFRLTFLEGTATLKIASFTMTTMAAIVFASKGAIHYPMAAALFSGCAIGSYFGAHYSDRIGTSGSDGYSSGLS
jgi:hypothetical protein